MGDAMSAHECPGVCLCSIVFCSSINSMCITKIKLRHTPNTPKVMHRFCVLDSLVPSAGRLTQLHLRLPSLEELHEAL